MSETRRLERIARSCRRGGGLRREAASYFGVSDESNSVPLSILSATSASVLAEQFCSAVAGHSASASCASRDASSVAPRFWASRDRRAKVKARSKVYDHTSVEPWLRAFAASRNDRLERRTFSYAVSLPLVRMAEREVAR